MRTISGAKDAKIVEYLCFDNKNNYGKGLGLTIVMTLKTTQTELCDRCKIRAGSLEPLIAGRHATFEDSDCR